MVASLESPQTTANPSEPVPQTCAVHHLPSPQQLHSIAQSSVKAWRTISPLNIADLPAEACIKGCVSEDSIEAAHPIRNVGLCCETAREQGRK
jgi:hypothetical protein